MVASAKKGKASRSRIVVTRNRGPKGAGVAVIRRSRLRQDPERENRISMEVVVDAYGGAERAMGWFGYLQERLKFPFTAKCITRRAISPLAVGDEVEVIAMAPCDECMHDMFVMIRWKHDGLGVPLSQLETTSSSAETRTSIADWHYWVGQGYTFCSAGAAARSLTLAMEPTAHSGTERGCAAAHRAR